MPKFIDSLLSRLRMSGSSSESRSHHYQGTGLGAKVVRRQLSRTKRDIRDWKIAEQRALSSSDPRFYLLQDLYREVNNDALLSSQLQNRFSRTLSRPYELVGSDGVVNDELTADLRRIGAVPTLQRAIVEAEFYGYSLVELSLQSVGKKALPGAVTAQNLPRRNIDPVFGRFFPDTQEERCINYRELPDYGTWLLEFVPEQYDLGLLNKTVPHVLFKKFAQSCWSELCEIYGVPPRYLKTNTTDPEMLARGEQMMREMGHAAAFVIDNTEDFSFAAGVQTKGEVYENLIRVCNQEMSLLVSSAVIGQDTANGNYSKEQAGLEVLDQVAGQDRKMVEHAMNEQVLPALVSLRLLPEGLTFRYCAAEDTDKTWSMVKDVLPYKDVDSKWMKEKFGIPVRDKSPLSSEERDNLSLVLQAATGGDPRFFG